jgi:hypothetical protein
MSDLRNAGVTMHMTGIAMIQKLENNSYNHGEERGENTYTRSLWPCWIVHMFWKFMP